MKKIPLFFVHLSLIFCILALFIPLYASLVMASQESGLQTKGTMPLMPGRYLLKNIKTVLFQSALTADAIPLWRMLLNSFIMALSIALGKIALAMSAAFALVYFKLPYKKTMLALIFSTMFLPIELRIVPTFAVVASLNMLNSFSGLSFPLMVSATATFLFRQFFKTMASDLVDAAILDGASPWRFFKDILWPLSQAQVASLFLILFIYGWNQYLWPLVITTDASMATIVMGIRYLADISDQVPQWHLILTVAWMAMLPPCLLLVAMQRFFVKGFLH